MKILGRAGRECYPTKYIVEIADTELSGLEIEVGRDENPREVPLDKIIEKNALIRKQNYKVQELIRLLEELRPPPEP